MSRTWVLAATALALSGCSGCKEEPLPPPPATPPLHVAKPVTPPGKQPKIEDAVASVPGHSDPACVGPIENAVPQKVTIAGKPAELNGYKLTFAAAEKKDQPVVFGVVGGINEDSGENLVNLKKYVEFFKAEKADAIIVDGDSGEAPESIVRALTPLAETGLPMFVVVGNRECGGAFNDGVNLLQKTFSNVVNLGKVRHVQYGAVDLISLPGYHDKRYLHCPTGCQYFKQDVDALKPIAKAATSPVVLVTHGPPHGSTPLALDAATGAGNVGDVNLNALIADGNIPFGVFANIKEAGGRATDLDGTTVIKQETLSDRLYLNPGPADSVAWAMNDGTQSVGMAGVLTVQGRQAKYKIFRARSLTTEEKTLAAKLGQIPETKEEAAAPKKEEAPKK